MMSNFSIRVSKQASHMELVTNSLKKLEIYHACEKYFLNLANHIPVVDKAFSVFIKKEHLLKLLPLEGVIGERLFCLLDLNKIGLVNIKDLTSFAKIIYTGTLQERMKLVFQIYDYDNNGSISKEEIRRVLSFIPLNIPTAHTTAYDFFVNSQQEIMEMIDQCFESKTFLLFDDFSEITQNKSSDMFFTLFQYIFDQLPSEEDLLPYFSKEPANIESGVVTKAASETQLISILKHLKDFEPNKRIYSTLIEIRDSMMDIADEDTTNISINGIREFNPQESKPKECRSNSPKTVKIESQREEEKSCVRRLKSSESSIYIKSKQPKDGEFENELYAIFNDDVVPYKTVLKGTTLILKHMNNETVLPLKLYYASAGPTCHKTDYSLYPIIFKGLKQLQLIIYAKHQSVQKDLIEAINSTTHRAVMSEKYILGEPIKQGCVSNVRLATRMEDDKKVAIKIFHLAHMVNPGQLKKEADTLKMCKHPNIVQCYETIETLQDFCIVMEYLSGGSTLKCIQHPIPETKIVYIIECIATALFYLHEFGMVHGAIHLENILFTDSSESEVKLVGFGLTSYNAPNQHMKAKIGADQYCSPEVLLYKPFNSKIDVWALGVVLYALLFLELPFMGSSDEIKEKIIYAEPLFKNPSIGRTELAIDLVNKMLKKDPDERLSIEGILCHKFIGHDISGLKVKSNDKLGKFKKFSKSMRNLNSEKKAETAKATQI